MTLARRAALLPLLLILTLSGCESAIPGIHRGSPPFQGRTDRELSDLELGRSTYIAKCSGCHILYRPARGHRKYWEHWVERMAERSRLTSKERRRILSYLVLVCLTGQ